MPEFRAHNRPPHRLGIEQHLPAWLAGPRQWVEWFVLMNLAFLAVDIFIAHSINDFAHPAEWIPLIFSFAVPPILLISFFFGALTNPHGRSQWVGAIIGWLAIGVGVAGLIFHLGSQFFEQATLRSLVYTAPFVAPLSYAGIGMLLILNRTVESTSAEWAGWVIVLTGGGFAGNFILSLADHAQNGFYQWQEWIPVVAAALAIGFLLAPLVLAVDRSFIVGCLVVMLIQCLVGILGAWYHFIANFRGPAESWLTNFLYGAPAFAPLLFPNLAMLGAIGLYALRPHVPDNREVVMRTR